MAKPLKPDDNLEPGKANAGHNVGDMKPIIRECAAAMQVIEDKRAELNDEAADIRQRLKDAGIPVPTFNLSRRIQKLEAEAQADYMANLHLANEALGVGAQTSLFIDDAAAAAASVSSQGAAGATTH